MTTSSQIKFFGYQSNSYLTSKTLVLRNESLWSAYDLFYVSENPVYSRDNELPISTIKYMMRIGFSLSQYIVNKTKCQSYSSNDKWLINCRQSRVISLSDEREHIGSRWEVRKLTVKYKFSFKKNYQHRSAQLIKF